MTDIGTPRWKRQQFSRPRLSLTPRSRSMAVAALLGLSTVFGAGASLANAAPLTTPQATTADMISPASIAPTLLDDHDTFTRGVLTDISKHKIDVRLPNDDTQTFKLDDDTVIRDEDGNRKSHDDLQVGDVVIITNNDGDDTADLLVDGGLNGFRQGGAFDIGGRLDERGRWDWQSRAGEAAPFDPRAMGAARRYEAQNNGQPPQQQQPFSRRFGWDGRR